MNRAAAAELIIVGASAKVSRPSSCARGTSGLGREMRACANVAGGTNLLGARDDGEVVGMAEAAGRSRYG